MFEEFDAKFHAHRLELIKARANIDSFEKFLKSNQYTERCEFTDGDFTLYWRGDVLRYSEVGEGNMDRVTYGDVPSRVHLRANKMLVPFMQKIADSLPSCSTVQNACEAADGGAIVS